MYTMPIGKTTIPRKPGYVEVELLDGTRTYQNLETGLLIEDDPEQEPEPEATLEERVSSLENAIERGLSL